jgi:hypothetical protein
VTTKTRQPPPGGIYFTGWTWPVDARKVHYAVDGVLICGSNYGVFPGEEQPTDYNPESDLGLSCRTCLRKLTRKQG